MLLVLRFFRYIISYYDLAILLKHGMDESKNSENAKITYVYEIMTKGTWMSAIKEERSVI